MLSSWGARRVALALSLFGLASCQGCDCWPRPSEHSKPGCGSVRSSTDAGTNTNDTSSSTLTSGTGLGGGGTGGAVELYPWQAPVEVCDGVYDEDWDGLVDEDCAPSLWAGLFPPGGGADLATAGVVAAVELDSGRALGVLQTYHATSPLGVANLTPDLVAIWAHGAVPHLNLEPSGYTPAEYGADPVAEAITVDLGAVAEAIADAVHGDPALRLLVTFGAEMNGSWVDWGCLPAASFIALHRKAHELVTAALAARGVDPRRVRWVFGPNSTSSPGCPSGAAYYPGHDAVDLVGLSAYRSGTATVDDAVVGPAHALLADLGYDAAWSTDRFVVLQTGTRDEPGDDSGVWVEELYLRLTTDPVFAGAIYFGDAAWALLGPDGLGGLAEREGYPAWTAALGNLPVTDPALEALFAPWFWDVPAIHPRFAEIQALHDALVTSGCATSPPLYCPDELLTRRDAAVLLGRAFAVTPDWAMPYYDDVPATDPAWGFVQALGASGVLPPCAPDSFCPDDPVLRIDLGRAVAALTGADHVASAPGFDDLAGIAGASGIDALATVGLVDGCAPGLFCPDAPCTRGDGGAWIARGAHLEYQLAQP